MRLIDADALCAYLNDWSKKLHAGVYHTDAIIMDVLMSVYEHIGNMPTVDLEQVKQERDGLNIMLTQAQSMFMLETRTRERDAAVEDLKGICNFCAHMETCTGYWCEDCDEFEGCESPCKNCEVAENWQWRGIKEE